MATSQMGIPGVEPQFQERAERVLSLARDDDQALRLACSGRGRLSPKHYVALSELGVPAQLLGMPQGVFAVGDSFRASLTLPKSFTGHVADGRTKLHAEASVLGACRAALWQEERLADHEANSGWYSWARARPREHDSDQSRRATGRANRRD
jgi:hypothetical protein